VAIRWVPTTYFPTTSQIAQPGGYVLSFGCDDSPAIDNDEDVDAGERWNPHEDASGLFAKRLQGEQKGGIKDVIFVSMGIESRHVILILALNSAAERNASYPSGIRGSVNPEEPRQVRRRVPQAQSRASGERRCLVPSRLFIEVRLPILRLSILLTGVL
jgi:hypothetical protein